MVGNRPKIGARDREACAMRPGQRAVGLDQGVLLSRFGQRSWPAPHIPRQDFTLQVTEQLTSKCLPGFCCVQIFNLHTKKELH